MISKEKFIQKVQTEVFPQLLSTEKARKKALLIGVIWIFIALFLLIFINLIFNDENNGLLKESEGYAVLFIFVGIEVWHNFLRKEKKVFSPIFLSFLGQLENKQTAIKETLLKHTCLFNRFDYIEYDDCISGIFENTLFSVAEIKLNVVRGNKSSVIFKGVCIDIPMNLPVSGYTLLYNTKLPQPKSVLKKITLEDVSFGKKYQIYSDNQIDARVLLTPAFMEKLNNLQRCFRNKRIDVSFFGNHAVFVIHTRQNLFESYPLFRKLTNTKTYEKFYDEIKAIYDMIKILSINNKSVPVGCSFKQDLYQKISSFKQKRSLSDASWFKCLIIVLLFLLSIFIFGTIGALLGFDFTVYALIFLGIMLLLLYVMD